MSLFKDEYGDKKNILPVIISATLIIVLAVVSIVSANQLFTKRTVAKQAEAVTQEVVQTYLEEYASSAPNDQVLDTITKEVAERVDTTLSAMNIQELSEDDMQEIMVQVSSMLHNTELKLPQAEINNIAASITSEVIAKNAELSDAITADYTASINKLADRLSALETQINPSDVAAITSNNQIMQDKINQLVSEKITIDATLDQLESKYGSNVSELKTLISSGDSANDKKITEVANKLGVKDTELKSDVDKANTAVKELRAEISKMLTSDNGATSEELYALADKTDTDIKKSNRVYKFC